MHAPPDETLGQRLVRLREEAGYTQEEMAAIIGTRQSAYSRWERDMVVPAADTYLQIETVLQSRIAELADERARAVRRPRKEK